MLIGVADDALGQARLAAFHKGMQALEWAEGCNTQFEIPSAEATAVVQELTLRGSERDASGPHRCERFK